MVEIATGEYSNRWLDAATMKTLEKRGWVRLCESGKWELTPKGRDLIEKLGNTPDDEDVP